MTIRTISCALVLMFGVTACQLNHAVAAGQAKGGSKRFVGKWACCSSDGKQRYPSCDFEILDSGKVLVDGVVAYYEVIDSKRLQFSYTGHNILYTYEFTKNGFLILDTKSAIRIVHMGTYKRKKD